MNQRAERSFEHFCDGHNDDVLVARNLSNVANLRRVQVRLRIGNTARGTAGFLASTKYTYLPSPLRVFLVCPLLSLSMFLRSNRETLSTRPLLGQQHEA